MSELTPDRLRAVIHADAETGICTWLVSPNRRIRVGDVAGSLNGNGYIYIRVDGRKYLAHRLVWLYQTGEWPSAEIDHINGVRDDNRLANLREATRGQNAANLKRPRNNTSGFKGVTWFKPTRRWAAQIFKDGRHISLGYHHTPEAAHAAYVEAAERLHGEYGRAG